MSHIDELKPLLRRLRLSGLLDTLDLRIGEFTDDGIGAHEFLYRLLNDEVERRSSGRLQRLIRAAKFESTRSVAEFDFAFNPKISKQRLTELATCGFVRRHENLLLVGPAGVGKSHLAQAIGLRACQLDLRVRYTSAHQLFTTLRAARGDGSYDKRLAELATVDVLIIDDLGLRALTGDEPSDLYEIIRKRYERTSTIITSNRDVPEWMALFGDPLLASAAMDRLLHHCHVVVLEGRSYRTQNRIQPSEPT